MTGFFHPFVDLPCIVLISTMWMWAWARWKSRFALLSQEREQIKRQNRLASMTFAGLLVLEALTFVMPEVLAHALFPLSATILFLRFATATGKLRDGFWTHRRNVLLASITLVGISFCTPFVMTEPITVPLLYSIWVTQICLGNIARIFRENIRDLEALQSKLLSLEAEHQRERLIREVTPRESTAPIPLDSAILRA